jgi:hypothetical protein
MLTIPLLSLFAVSAVLAQDTGLVLTPDHNATSIEGTWSTGSGGVVTGPGSVNPINMSIVYPRVTGRSFSFTDSGFWEQFDYRMASNATRPDCITGVITWQHGQYQMLPNGSLYLVPFEGDGFQQVQGRCGAISNQINRYNQPILFLEWRIFPLISGGYHLNLYEFDGTPVAPMNQLYKPPTMNPTQAIMAALSSSASASATQTSKAKREIAARSSATKAATLMFGSVTALTGLGALLVFL